jgi:hypothetical protein
MSYPPLILIDSGVLVAYYSLKDNYHEEYMDGIIRCGSVISKDAHGNEITDHQELIDNTEYHSVEELVADVAKRLNVSPDIVEIAE